MDNVFPGLQDRINDLNGALLESLGKFTVVADKAGDTGFDKTIENLAADINATRLAIEATIPTTTISSSARKRSAHILRT